MTDARRTAEDRLEGHLEYLRDAMREILGLPADAPDEDIIDYASERLRAAPASAPPEPVQGWRHYMEGWEHECEDGDRIMAALGIEGETRTEGGWLRVDKALERIAILKSAPALLPAPQEDK